MNMTRSAVAAAFGTTLLLYGYPGKSAERLIDDFTFTYQIEVAGADTSDVATEKELRESGTKMVPAQPSASSRDPLKQEPAKEVKAATPKPVPTSEPKPEPATAAATQNAPANAAQETSPPPSGSDKAVSPEKMAKLDDAEKDLLFRPYLRIDTGYALTNDPDGTGVNGPHLSSKTQNTGLISIGLGAKVDDQVRVEGMMTYRSPMSIDGKNGAGQTQSGEVSSISAMFNMYYDIEQAHKWFGSSMFTPYVGAGVGLSLLDTDSLVTTGGTTERGTQVYNLTYAAMAGVTAKVSDMISIDAGYRFINLGQYEQDGTFSSGTGTTATKYDDLFAHEFRAGLRFQF